MMPPSRMGQGRLVRKLRMFGRKTLIAGLCVYGLVIGCVVWPSESASKPADADAHLVALNGLPYCGASMQLHDVTKLEGTKKPATRSTPTAATRSCSSPAGRWRLGPATSSTSTCATPSPSAAQGTHHPRPQAGVARHPHADRAARRPQGQRVARHLHPDDWDAWFSSYQDMILFYARVAQQTDVNMLVVGSELVSSEPFVDEWRKPSTMCGRCSRATSPTRPTGTTTTCPVLGVARFDGDEQLLDAGHGRQRQLLVKSNGSGPPFRRTFSLLANVHKPVLLLEAGWCSLANASYEPWDYTKVDLALDLDLQTRCTRGSSRAGGTSPSAPGSCSGNGRPNPKAAPKTKATPREENPPPG